MPYVYSPELDMAVKTICAMTRAGQLCDMSYYGQHFSIQTYVDTHDGKDHIGSAYPIFD